MTERFNSNIWYDCNSIVSEVPVERRWNWELIFLEQFSLIYLLLHNWLWCRFLRCLLRLNLSFALSECKINQSSSSERVKIKTFQKTPRKFRRCWCDIIRGWEDYSTPHKQQSPRCWVLIFLFTCSSTTGFGATSSGVSWGSTSVSLWANANESWEQVKKKGKKERSMQF